MKRLVLFMVLAIGLQAAPKPDPIAKTRAAYDQACEKARQAYQAKLGTVSASYLTALGNLQNRYQRGKDSLALASIQSEMKRFKTQKSLSQANLVSGPAPLVTLQRNMLVTLAPEQKRLQARLDAADKRYIELLNKLKVSLTQRQRFDDAIAVSKEIERFSSKTYAVSGSHLSGLVQHFSFDRPSGTEIKDSSTNAYHGVKGNATWSSDGYIGGGMLPGESAPSLDTRFAPGSEGTVALWIRPAENLNAASPDTGILDCAGRNSIFRLNWAKEGAGSEHANGAIDFSITRGAGSYSVVSTRTTEWKAGTWYHLVATWDGVQQQIFVNGLLENRIDQTHQHEFNRLELNTEFKGCVDEFILWNRALDADSVLKLYRAQGGR